jgi:ketosteroid isomerase-like protein
MKLIFLVGILCGTARAEVASEVRKVLDAQVEAWNKKDLEGYMAGYWKSPELSFYGGTNATRGWQPTLDRYRKKYSAESMGTLSFEDVTVEALGENAALVRGRWKLSGGRSGLFTLIFKRLAEGWRIVHDHSC